MSTHVHLLLTPDEPCGMSRLMHAFASNSVCTLNGRRGGTDTLWEGRYKACLVDSESDFLACSRYIELDPVRAWMAAQPNEHHDRLGRQCRRPHRSLLTMHSEYLALSSNRLTRASAYRALFAEALPDALVAEIRAYLQQQKVLGTNRFRAWVETRTGRFAAVRPVGRLLTR